MHVCMLLHLSLSFRLSMSVSRFLDDRALGIVECKVVWMSGFQEININAFRTCCWRTSNQPILNRHVLN